MKLCPQFLLVLVLWTGGGCGRSGLNEGTTIAKPVVEESATNANSAEAVATVADTLPKKLESTYLPNPVRIHTRVISGGLPANELAFQELADWGVKTIISVDGMTPNVETARKFGMRYVHLPHGYNGIPEQRVKELAKAVRELQGPIYIHCHHGKHRSPAAASVACVSAGLIPPGQAFAMLSIAGTNPNYQGLFQSVREAEAMEAALLEELKVEFLEVQEIPPMAEAMVELSHAQDHLKLIANAGWDTPPDHPDLEPAHEALLIREIFTELLRTEEVSRQPRDFQAWLQHSEAAAQELETELKRWAVSQGTPPARLSELAQQISLNCQACHAAYRDVPLGQKRDIPHSQKRDIPLGQKRDQNSR